MAISFSRIEIVEGEEVFDIDWESKGIRLDVYVKGDDKILTLTTEPTKSFLMLVSMIK